MSRIARVMVHRAAFALMVAAVTVAATSRAEGAIIPSFNVNQAFVDNETSATGPVNPNGPYSYGYNFPTNASGAPLQFGSLQMGGLIHTSASGFAGDPDIQGYYYPNPQSVPAVVGNVTNHSTSTSFATLAPGELLLHPGATNTSSAYDGPIAYADLRYTVPTAQGGSLYNISGSFSGLDSGGPSVYVFVNGTSAFSGAVSQGTLATFNISTYLAAGSTVDFLVGPSANGGIGSDSTGLFANIVATPEPSTLVSLGIAALIGSTYSLRRRRAGKASA